MQWKVTFKDLEKYARHAAVALFSHLFISTSALAGPDTIAIIDGEVLKGGFNRPVADDTAIGGHSLKVRTPWPAVGLFDIDDIAYKILVSGSADTCDGSPILEVLIDDQVVLSETYTGSNWHLGIENINLPAGRHKISARLANPYLTYYCQRAVHLDIIYIEKHPTVTTPPAPNPSGETIPLGDLPGWSQIFVDDFNTNVALGDFPSAVDDKWSAYPYPWRDTRGQRSSNPEIGGWYYPEKTVSIADGVMNIWLHSEFVDGANKRLVSAPLPKIHGAESSVFEGQQYGRYAIRFRADMVKGYKTAWLLWPDSGVHPRDGEIDFPEGNLTGDIQGYMHWMNATRGDQQYYALSGQSYYDWHTAVIEWEPDRVAFYLDGELMLDASEGKSEWFDKIPNTPMHWVIQTETRLDDFQPSTADQGNVQIDWVAVWKRTPPAFNPGGVSF